jgi:shikimate dehydrogenase
MSKIDTATKLCAVIANPVEHSLSPSMHNAAFEAAGLNFVYLAFRVEDVAACLAGIRAMPGFRGVSVTIPHKIAVMEHLDEVEPMAQRVGCVNTIVNDDGCLIGSTTDGPGTLRAFQEAGVSLDGKKILFLGSGGAVRAVAFAMAELTQAKYVSVLGRTASRVDALVDDLAAKTPMKVYGGELRVDLSDAMAAHDVVIHGTPIGMHPNAGESCVSKQLLRPDQVVFDMVYRPFKTKLLQDAEDVGCTTIPGVEMLINQAVLQFERWTGTEAPYQAMRDAVLAELTKK